MAAGVGQAVAPRALSAGHQLAVADHVEARTRPRSRRASAQAPSRPVRAWRLSYKPTSAICGRYQVGDAVARAEADFNVDSGAWTVARLNAGKPITAWAGVHSENADELFANEPVRAISDLNGDPRQAARDKRRSSPGLAGPRALAFFVFEPLKGSAAPVCTARLVRRVRSVAPAAH